ncbi:TIGR01620 family protein [Ascidiaceihabitans sp.]|uniref:YcjF family protein n=1 Tax=Ascidiaceihabitans sp. TaxID=1872644 RepID=UPI00329873FD
MAKGPVLIDLEPEDAAQIDVAAAPPVPDLDVAAPKGQAMQVAAKIASGKPSRLARLFWFVTLTLLGGIVSLSAWNFVTDVMATYPLLGLVFSGLMALFVILLALMAVRELAALGRLTRIDGLRHATLEARETKDLKAARATSDRVLALYKGREDTRWGRERVTQLQGDQLDASGLLDLTEREVLASLDTAAAREVQAAARQVATVTALVPLALADVVAALTANLRMIRRVAEVYGGRSGLFGSWRLTRAVMTHLVATGAVAVGDDMLEPILGGSILGKLSRRFGEGLVNGALTARVGVAAIEVCRPMAFNALDRPKARVLVKQALAGLFNNGT